ncbi:MAG: YihY/virulence factor BrkB family protein [Caldilineaceae bacterium]|nr:YihY/virulence factor BrkB family protein [Caldilineaceae bacterium]
MMQRKDIWPLLQETYTQWSKDRAAELAAALAFYTAISIAPLLVLVIAVVGFFLGQEAAQGQLVAQLRSLMGEEAAQFTETAIANADRPTIGGIASLLSIAVLLWGSTNVFTQLQNSLNIIWNVAAKSGNGFIELVRTRLLSFGLVLGIGFLLLVSLLFSTILNTIAGTFSAWLPGVDWLWQLLNFVVSLGIMIFLFAMIFKWLPDIQIAWKDVWIGAVITAVLFTIGQFALSFYLSNQGSAYGVAGSLVVFLLWVYYSAQILFFGAEFTQVYATTYGRGQGATQTARQPSRTPAATQARAQQAAKRRR